MNIIELAKQAGFSQLDFYGNKVGTNVADCLTRFASLIRAAALEEAAVVCDEAHELMNSSFQGAAAAIRQLKETK